MTKPDPSRETGEAAVAAHGISDLQSELAEVLRQRSAISEVLRAIANSPHDLQPIFETILDRATLLCRADGGTLRLIEKEGVRLVAQKLSPALKQWYSPLPLAAHDSYVGRNVASRSPVHIPDLSDEELYKKRDPTVVALVKAGMRTTVFVPMLRNDDVIGALAIWRERIEPFAGKQIELIADFAAQAAIALEITRRERQLREVQSELAHANRVTTMGLLTASIAHEINQPLAAVVTNANTSVRCLARARPDIEQAKLCAERIIRDTGRAAHIIGEIQNIVKKRAPRTELLDINNAILDIMTLIHGEALTRGVKVQTCLPDSLPRIRGDRVQIQQVVLNFAVNGIQAMGCAGEDERELYISTERTAEGIQVSVRDTGPGLDPNSIYRLFEPFYTTKPSGIGLGLSICRSIIEDHGGQTRASACKPHGALFEFTIPAS
jgi:signal transduction histidine kinase